MELNSDSEKQKDNQCGNNGTDFQILDSEEAFWQRAVELEDEISESIVDTHENVSK